jgi:hypothetical protein
MQTVKIDLPQEDYSIIEFSQNGLVGMATINAALKNFKHKNVFPWHLSLVIVCEDINDEKIPTKTEHEVLRAFEEKLGNHLQANGNALFLASITKNGYRELIWRVYQPEIANDYLHELIETENHPRPFDFTLEEDKGWFKTQWHFNMLDKQPDYDMPGNAQ